MRISFLILMTIAATARAQTVAYWRFEDGADKQQVAATQPIRDFSGNGNDLQTANENTAPRFSTTIPSATVTQTGEPNHLALDNTAAPSARLPTRDLYTVHEGGGTDLNTVPLAQWTVEASVMFTPVANWQRRFQTFVGREGYNVPERPADHEDPLANLGFKKRGDTNQLSIEAFDSTGTYVIVQGAKPVEPDVWYHVAAVSDGTKLALYVKGPGDPEYVRQAEAPFHGPLANSGRYWTVGRGCFTDYPTEQFFGLIDEVRISASALSAPEFLTSPPGSAPRSRDCRGAVAPATRPVADLAEDHSRPRSVDYSRRRHLSPLRQPRGICALALEEPDRLGAAARRVHRTPRVGEARYPPAAGNVGAGHRALQRQVPPVLLDLPLGQPAIGDRVGRQ